ncbi:MAG TPA: hypothetical protein VFQ56_09115, partial [Flavobacterium sp.]|nr:hypothetical protein [Flavobacterium sp.]
MTQKITFVFLFLFLFSCSKKNNETPVDTKPIEKIDAYRYQLVKVDMGSISLTENSYAGVFASKNITLSKISDTELSFYVSENTPLGDTELAISTLGNYKKSVRVNDVKLSQTVEE